MTLIQLKDMCYYEDNFEYTPYLIDNENTEGFNEKYEQLEKICHTYQDFNEVEDFINNNFKVIPFEKRVIEI